MQSRNTPTVLLTRLANVFSAFSNKMIREVVQHVDFTLYAETQNLHLVAELGLGGPKEETG